MLPMSDKDTMKQKGINCIQSLAIFLLKKEKLQNLKKRKKKILPETAVDYEENRNQEGGHLTGIHKGICPGIGKKKAGLSL